MLAPNKIPNLTDLSYPIMVQPKLDGFRCIYKQGQFFSRTGKSLGNSNLAGFYDLKNFPQDTVLDGELYNHDLSFPKLSSILRRDGAEIIKNTKYYIFDAVPLEAWEKQDHSKIYQKRLGLIRAVTNDIICNYEKVIDIPTDICNTPKEVVDFYKYYIDKGYEGLMLKDPNGVYEWRRVSYKSGNLFKLKKFKTIDLKITGVYEGTKRLAGLAGGVTVDYNGGELRVGSGFEDSTRLDMISNPNSYVGKFIEIRYFSESEKGSLRFPTFIRFRPDKD